MLEVFSRCNTKMEETSIFFREQNQPCLGWSEARAVIWGFILRAVLTHMCPQATFRPLWGTMRRLNLYLRHMIYGESPKGRFR